MTILGWILTIMCGANIILFSIWLKFAISDFIETRSSVVLGFGALCLLVLALVIPGLIWGLNLIGAL
jgi:hypothetical protein